MFNPNKQMKKGDGKHKGCKLAKKESTGTNKSRIYLLTDETRHRDHRKQEMDKGRRCKVEQDTGEKGIKSNQEATHKLFIKTTLESGVKLMPSEAKTLSENPPR